MPPSPSEARQMLDELDDASEGLSTWETNFIESLLNWNGPFTPAQSKKLVEVWDRHFGDG